MITFVGSSNVSNGVAQGTSAVVPKPGSVVNGDFLLAFVSIGNTGTIGAPAGWTEVSLGTNTAPNLQNRIYFKVASGEPASWTWTFSSAAYVGICHATRGAGTVFAANQSDDGLSLLAHTTPVVAAPANAWLVSSWTGRNLLALGWSPPSGDVERQDVVGGLLILLNVNHAVDDTNGPVAAGNHSKTANTLIAVRSLNALVALAPVLDPVMLGEVKSPLSFGTPGVGLDLGVPQVLAPVTFGSSELSLNAQLSGVTVGTASGILDVEHGVPLSSGTSAPVSFGAFGTSMNAGVGGLSVMAVFAALPVLPEQEIMVFPGLPVSITPGMGGLSSISPTLHVSENPGMIERGTSFGKPIMYQEFTQPCCTP